MFGGYANAAKTPTETVACRSPVSLKVSHPASFTYKRLPRSVASRQIRRWPAMISVATALDASHAAETTETETALTAVAV